MLDIYSYWCAHISVFYDGAQGRVVDARRVQLEQLRKVPKGVAVISAQVTASSPWWRHGEEVLDRGDGTLDVRQIALANDALHVSV